tara:strand:- start:26092 stop:26424 length:333 start_codon:yes stop_codon:yes gene_type:complete
MSNIEIEGVLRRSDLYDQWFTAEVVDKTLIGRELCIMCFLWEWQKFMGEHQECVTAIALLSKLLNRTSRVRVLNSSYALAPFTIHYHSTLARTMLQVHLSVGLGDDEEFE